jgi:hypothetical protein
VCSLLGAMEQWLGRLLSIEYLCAFNLVQFLNQEHRGPLKTFNTKCFRMENLVIETKLHHFVPCAIDTHQKKLKKNCLQHSVFQGKKQLCVIVFMAATFNFHYSPCTPYMVRNQTGLKFSKDFEKNLLKL